MSLNTHKAIHEELMTERRAIGSLIDEASKRWDGTLCLLDSLHIQRDLIKANPESKPGDMPRNSAAEHRAQVLYHTQLARIAMLYARWDDLSAPIEENLATDWLSA